MQKWCHTLIHNGCTFAPCATNIFILSFIDATFKSSKVLMRLNDGSIMMVHPGLAQKDVKSIFNSLERNYLTQYSCSSQEKKLRPNSVAKNNYFSDILAEMISCNKRHSNFSNNKPANVV